MQTTSPMLRTVEQFAQAHPAFKPGALRSLIFHSKDSTDYRHALAPAFKRLGRRVLIDEGKFFACVDALNDSTALNKLSGKGRRQRLVRVR